MSKATNAVVFALICGLILFIVLPHALAALDRWRFLRRLRRAFENGAMQPRWPSDAAVCPREIKDLCQVWMNSSVVFGNDEIDMPLLGGFTSRNDQLCALLPKVPKTVTPGETLRNRVLAFRRKPSVLPSTSTSISINPNPPAIPQRFPGTLQFATLITMPSLRSSKLYNTTPVSTSCSSLPNASPARPAVPSNGAHRHTNASVVGVSEPRPGVPCPPAPAAIPEVEDSSFLSTLHLGVCTRPLTLDASLIPSPPHVPSPSGTERAHRDVPLHPMFRIGYAGGAGVMIVDAPPRRSRDEQDEDDWNQVWMWRGF